MSVHIEPLRRKHARRTFDCGDAALNDFIERHARQNQETGVSRTYVAVPAGEVRVVGYYTLVASSADVDTLPISVRRQMPRYRTPLVQLARLAVDLSSRGRGTGGELLLNALAQCVRAAELVGVYAVEVYAKHETASSFYRRHGFAPFDDHSRHLFLPIATARALL